MDAEKIFAYMGVKGVSPFKKEQNCGHFALISKEYELEMYSG